MLELRSGKLFRRFKANAMQHLRSRKILPGYRFIRLHIMRRRDLLDNPRRNFFKCLRFLCDCKIFDQWGSRVHGLPFRKILYDNRGGIDGCVLQLCGGKVFGIRINLMYCLSFWEVCRCQRFLELLRVQRGPVR